MKIEEFGEQLIKTGDLDPVYNAIVGANLDQEQLSRLLVAYWYFYHLGFAAWVSEFEHREYWLWMEVAAENDSPRLNSPPSATGLKRWPRSAERRHFRGKKSVEAIQGLRGYSSAKQLIEVLLVDGLRAETVMAKIKLLPMCGEWISFKAADMLERCIGIPITFPDDLCYIYAQPRAALTLLAPEAPEVEMKRLRVHFRRFTAPPTNDRPCGVQEVETVLCKFKSYINGHYWVGKDIHEIREGLNGWGTTAEELLDSCPKEVKSGVLF